jgi:hypothetical protein
MGRGTRSNEVEQYPDRRLADFVTKV